ncbi:ComEC/Rec2 family competence protein [Sphingomonas sp.]|uniref:ComEC/Rec2 family competence protein n=1 Tax=Sphingomonas sp. TaxID=28214 RepID=UPI0025DA3FE6|nr:ComEC/Rec2 family competence protein [Sphingomonas sp.]MBV9528946.1 ComEC/Rec2 family competence protein [Sphingomonas sp.]
MSAWNERLEKLLEAERAQLPPWLVVGLGTGIAAWFALGVREEWAAVICLGAALFVTGLVTGGGRAGRALGLFGLAMALGCGLVWARADWVAAPRMAKPAVVSLAGRVELVERLVARGTVRLTLITSDPALPHRVRVSIDAGKAPADLAAGSEVQVRARLAPPPPMALPGSYDFARDAWFWQIGAVGKALGPVTVVNARAPTGLDLVRQRLGDHVRTSLPSDQAGIAIALVTGDQNSVSESDATAMRSSGLTHLLSVSGLHIAAVVAAAMFLSLKLLAMSERLALRFNLVLVSAGVAAAAGIGYTLLTGAQVPTVRSCVAALLILLGIALGRDAINLRLVAAGALVVLLFRPEALAGPSFQMSFGSVTAIIALHSTGWARRLFERREEGPIHRLLRTIAAIVLTGLAVEFALMPMALFHFQRSGLYGVGANIIAIPLTTFAIMPLEAGALLLDVFGLGRPLWWLTGLSLKVLLTLARSVAALPGAVAMLPSMPPWAFGLMILGFLWLCLWTTRLRLLGLVPFAMGAIGAWGAPSPDVLVTGDGKHLVVVEDGRPLLLRDAAGDYVRQLFAQASGFDGDPANLGSTPSTACTRDSCTALIRKGTSEWRLLATRSSTRMDWQALTGACAGADIVVSDRRLPRGCGTRWLRLDKTALGATGGIAIYLGRHPRVDTVAERIEGHPWHY